MTILIVLAVLFSTVLFAGLFYRSRVPDEPRRETVDSLRLDPETATWFELAQLPGIGETLARRITDYRDAQRRGEPTGDRVFRSAADLDGVSGIGPRTLERIAPYLCFPAAARHTQSSPN